MTIDESNTPRDPSLSEAWRQVDFLALEADLNALRDELRAGAGEADRGHLFKIVRWGRACTLLGWATAWIAPNPVSAAAMSLGIFARWTMVAHHVCHRGYDKVPEVPARLRSKAFATGWRRWLDWPDWLDPAAWKHEHNILHHYKLNEEADPDQPERNFDTVLMRRLPRPLRYVALALGMMTWRYAYYPANALRTLELAERRREDKDAELKGFFHPQVWAPWGNPGRRLWFGCLIPYVLIHFVLLPLPFLLLSPWAWASVLANRLLAEVLANIHSFIIIVPSHAGDDLLRFDEPIDGRGEFYFRQIAGSANYRTGGDLNDFLHGWLNYQIEHHLWPDMTMLQYRKAQPQVREICAKHGVPYVQESVWTRFRKLAEVAFGDVRMEHWTPQTNDDVLVAAS